MTGPRGRNQKGESAVRFDGFVKKKIVLRDIGDVQQIDGNLLVWLSVKQTEAHSVWPMLL